MHDELARGVQRRVARGVHVAHHEVGDPTLLERCVGAAVDGDDHRALVAHIRAQRAQVALVVDPADDDQRRTIAQLGGEVGKLDLTGQELALLPDVGDRVLGEQRQRLADAAAALLVLAAHRLRVLHFAGPQHLAVADQPPVADGHGLAVVEHLEQRGAGHVD